MNVGGRNVSGSTRGDSEDEPELVDEDDFEVDPDEEDENNPDDRLPTPGFVMLDVDADAGAGEATIYGRLRVLDSATVYDGGSCERGSWW